MHMRIHVHRLLYRLIHSHIHIHIHVHMQVHMHMQIRIHIHINIIRHRHINTHVHMDWHIHIHIHIDRDFHIHIHTHRHRYRHIHIRMRMHMQMLSTLLFLAHPMWARWKGVHGLSSCLSDRIQGVCPSSPSPFFQKTPQRLGVYECGHGHPPPLWPCPQDCGQDRPRPASRNETWK